MKKLFLMVGLGIVILLGGFIPSETEAARELGIRSFQKYLQKWGTVSRLKWRKPLPRLRYRYNPSYRRGDYLRQLNLPRSKYVIPTAEDTGGQRREERKRKYVTPIVRETDAQRKLDEARTKRLCGRKYLPQYRIDERECTCNRSAESIANHHWVCKRDFPGTLTPPPSFPPSTSKTTPVSRLSRTERLRSFTPSTSSLFAPTSSPSYSPPPSAPSPSYSPPSYSY